MTIKKSDPNVSYLKAVLQKMAFLSEEIIQKGIEGNENEVRRLIDQMRQFNSDLQEIGQNTISYFDKRPHAEQKEVSELLESINKSEGFRTAWSNRYKEIGNTDLLLTLEDGVDGILDMTLPGAWDWQNDLFIFSNYSNERFIRSLLERGQKRIVVFCIDEIRKHAPIEEVSYLREDTKLAQYLAGMQPNIPKRMITFDQLVSLDPSTPKSKKKTIDGFQKKIQKAYLGALVNKNTINLFGNRWLSQGLTNLPIIANQPSFRHMLEPLGGLPVVIVSPGPSLDKNIHLLKDLKNRAIIIAPAQTAQALQKAKVHPDIIMVADPADMSYLLEGYNFDEVSALLIGVSCHPDILQKYKEKVITFNVNGPIDTWISDLFEDTTFAGACGSVSSTAFLLSSLMQSPFMILVGQDLSFSKDKMYSSNSSDGQIKLKFDVKNQNFKATNLNESLKNILGAGSAANYDGKMVQVPGYYGGKVRTTPSYSLFLTEFERIAEANSASGNPPKMFNCTEGGAYIKGFEHAPLSDVINMLKNAQSETIDMKILFSKIFSSHDVQIRKKKLGLRLEEIQKSVTSGIILANECIALATKITKNKANIQDLSAKESQLTKEIRSSNFISMAVQDEIRNSLKLTEAATNLKENIDASLLLYKLVIRELDKIKPLVQAAAIAIE